MHCTCFVILFYFCFVFFNIYNLGVNGTGLLAAFTCSRRAYELQLTTQPIMALSAKVPDWVGLQLMKHVHVCVLCLYVYMCVCVCVLGGIEQRPFNNHITSNTLIMSLQLDSHGASKGNQFRE